MPSKTKRRVRKTPEEQEAERLLKRARDLEAVGLQPEAAVLATMADVEITREGEKRDGQKVGSDAARRPDAFTALKASLAPGCYDAARRLEADILTRFGWGDRGRTTERVDCTAGPITDARIKAAERIEDVTGRMSLRDAWLLTELIVGNPDRPLWRQTVAHITGETHTHAQGAAVRAACVSLRDAYAAIERKVAA